MIGPEERDESLEKYVKYTTAELITLRETHKVKINAKVESHWLTKLDERFKTQISKYIQRVALWLLGISLFILMVFVIIISVQTFQKKTGDISILTNYMFIPLIFMIFPAMVLQFMDDGTKQLRKELRDIELVLAKKEPSGHKKIMVDSNVFDDFISGKLKRDDMEKARQKGYTFYITHIQMDEVNDCPDSERRKGLNLFIVAAGVLIIPTESFVVGISRVGFSKVGDGQIINKLKAQGEGSRRLHDPLIAETALKNDYILLTNDENLRKKVHKQGGRAYSVGDFLSIFSN